MEGAAVPERKMAEGSVGEGGTGWSLGQARKKRPEKLLAARCPGKHSCSSFVRSACGISSSEVYCLAAFELIFDGKLLNKQFQTRP